MRCSGDSGLQQRKALKIPLKTPQTSSSNSVHDPKNVIFLTELLSWCSFRTGQRHSVLGVLEKVSVWNKLWIISREMGRAAGFLDVLIYFSPFFLCHVSETLLNPAGGKKSRHKTLLSNFKTTLWKVTMFDTTAHQIDTTKCNKY